MAEIKISELPLASSITGVEQIETVQDGVNKRMPLSMLEAPAASSTVAGLIRLAGALGGTPTTPTALGLTDQAALNTFVQALITAALDTLVDGAPAALNTLLEFSEAINNDPDFGTTVLNALAAKADSANAVLTGAPTAPTAAAGTNNTQLANTAFVVAAIALAQTVIANNLTTNSTTQALSAAQGIAIKALTDALESRVLVLESTAGTVANNYVTNAKLADMVTATIKGRISGTTGDPEDLTGAQVVTLLPTATESAKGLVPNLPGNSNGYLRSDNTWQAFPAVTAVIDSLSSTSTTDALSANQGNVLNAAIGANTTRLTVLEADDYATNAKLANVPTATFKGRTTAGTGDPEDLTITQAVALLPLATTGAKGLMPVLPGNTTTFLRGDGSFAATPQVAVVDTLLSFSSTDALSANQGRVLDDSVVTVSNRVTALEAGPANNSITNAKLSQVATATFKGRVSASTGNVEDLTVAQVIGLLPAVTMSSKGLVPQLTGNASDVFRGDGTFSADVTVVVEDNLTSTSPNTALSANQGRILKVGVDALIATAADHSTRIDVLESGPVDGTITNAKLANAIGVSFKGRIAGGSGPVTDLTAAQVVANLPLATNTLQGLTPAYPGNTTTFLRGDGSYAAVPIPTIVDNLTTGGVSSTLSAEQGVVIKAITDALGVRATALEANDYTTNAKLANVPTATFKGRVSAGTGDPEDLTAAQAVSLLPVATSGAKGLLPQLSGVNTQVLLGDGSFGAVPALVDGVVTNAKLATVATATIKGRITAGTGVVEDLTPAEVTALLPVATTGAKGLAPQRSGNVTDVLRGDGTYGPPPALDDGVVTNAKLSTVPTATFKGRATAGTGDVENLTAAQAAALLPLATVSVKGLAPVLSGSANDVLRGNGTYGAVPTAGLVTTSDLSTAGTVGKGADMVAVQYSAVNAVALNLKSYIEDDGSYNVMGFVSNTPGVKEAIRDGTTTTAVTVEFQDAIDTGRRIFIPRGKFIIEAPLNPTQGGVTGESSKFSRIICDACHAFEIPWNAGYDRPQAIIERLAVDSDSNSCDSKYVVYVPGVASGAAAVYNSGLLLQNIEWGRQGRFGGLAYLKDLYRATIMNCGGSDTSQIVKIVGSVVQADVFNVVCNNDGAGTALDRYGIHTVSANYSDIGDAVLESGHFKRIKYIRGDVAVYHTAGGAAVVYEDIDLEADVYGFYVNAPCTVIRGIVSPGVDSGAWVGVHRGISISDDDDATSFQNVNVKVLHPTGDPANSYGFDIGNGANPVHGFAMRDCVVHGEAGSLQSAIRGRFMNGVSKIDGTLVRASTCLGTHIDIQSGRYTKVRDTVCQGGTISISDAGDTSARGMITGNRVMTINTSLSTSDNWTISNPGVTGSPTRLVGETTSTFTGTLTGTSDGPFTGTFRYVLQGRQVTIYTPQVVGTSNSATATITGLPASLIPNREQNHGCYTRDNGNSAMGTARITTGGVIELYHGSNLSGFTSTGSKGILSSAITYTLD